MTMKDTKYMTKNQPNNMIQDIDFNNPRIVGVQMTGKLTEAETSPWYRELKSKLDQPGKIRLYIELDKLDGVTPKVAFNDFLFGANNLHNMTKLEKIAYVADGNWVDMAAGFTNLYPGIDAKQFSVADKEPAKAWITS